MRQATSPNKLGSYRKVIIINNIYLLYFSSLQFHNKKLARAQQALEQSVMYAFWHSPLSPALLANM